MLPLNAPAADPSVGGTVLLEKLSDVDVTFLLGIVQRGQTFGVPEPHSGFMVEEKTRR